MDTGPADPVQPPPVPLRTVFHEELDQLKLQVELMGVRVDQNLERMRQVLDHGDPHGVIVRSALAADDEIDAMHVSLLERCYGILGREAPVAGDLRYLVSIVRLLSELERIGDLALRVVKLAPDVQELSSCGPAWDIVRTLVEVAVDEYRTALRAWSTQDLALATRLVEEPPRLGAFHERLIDELRRLDGADVVAVAMHLFVAAQAADRIADHAAVIGARLRYLMTGDPGHLVAEVR
ncbi:MAG TPA: PhoU domain-containing protein [Acidimicrobiales bacterium]|nr:PhoU domain-containing protein [Acidimicrobiales bacterium]